MCLFPSMTGSWDKQHHAAINKYMQIIATHGNLELVVGKFESYIVILYSLYCGAGLSGTSGKIK